MKYACRVFKIVAEVGKLQNLAEFLRIQPWEPGKRRPERPQRCSGKVLSSATRRSNSSSLFRPNGVTLTEVVVSSMLIGMVLVGAMNVVGGALKTRRVAVAQLDGPRLADELLAEILSQPYEDPEEPDGSRGLNTGEAAPRANFDDVDDYENWTQSPPVDQDGTALSQYTGWTREANVWWADRIFGNPWFSDTGLKKIQVRVTAPDSTVYERWSFRHKDGALEQQPAVDTTVVTLFEAELQLGASTSAQAAVNLVNHPTETGP